MRFLWLALFAPFWLPRWLLARMRWRHGKRQTLQLVLRGSTRRSGVGLTVVAIVLVVIWIVLEQHWVVIPGING